MSQSEQISLSGQLRDAIYQAAIRQLRETPRSVILVDVSKPPSLTNAPSLFSFDSGVRSVVNCRL